MEKTEKLKLNKYFNLGLKKFLIEQQEKGHTNVKILKACTSSLIVQYQKKIETIAQEPSNKKRCEMLRALDLKYQQNIKE